VGEIKTFAAGADSKDLIDQLAKQGWVEAAGQSAIRKDFDELWKITGTDWGSADKTNVFFLPDLRGLFLRSWDHGRAAPGGHTQSPYTGDPGDLTQTRVQPRPEIDTGVGTQGATGDHVGSLQSDQVGSHQHTFPYNTKVNAFDRLSAPSNTTEKYWWGDNPSNPSTNAMPFAENRAANAYVMYFIYVGKPAQVIEPTAKEKEAPETRTGRIECFKDSKGRCKTKIEQED
jgi:hypothetical protein